MSKERIAVTVCRGCCCGTEKHPDTDHEGQVAQLERAGLRVRVADCLDVCEHSNVVVVHAGSGRGMRPVWLGGVLDEETTGQVAAWVARGGPGVARVPDTLRRQVIERPVRTKV